MERSVWRGRSGAGFLALLAAIALPATGGERSPSEATDAAAPQLHLEVPDDSYVFVPREGRPASPARRWQRGSQVSVQVNVDEEGNNMVGDAANEPSIAVDPTDPSRMAIGWRQFDTVTSNFRQAGWGYSQDGGATWTFPGVLEPGVFRSDPVLDADRFGNFFYHSLEGDFTCDLFTSASGGASWGLPMYAFGGDKAWMSVDRTTGLGEGHVYAAWSTAAGCCGINIFNRSIDRGMSFEPPVTIPDRPIWGVTAVGPEGEVYVAGRRDSSSSSFVVARSTDARNPLGAPTFDQVATVDLGGSISVGTGPNPGGLLGQVWVAADRSSGPRRGHLYVLASINPAGGDPLDIHFARSVDGGATWSAPIRVNDDAGSEAWQWFGTMSVAPDGRIDAVWNDTRADPGGFDSELYYAFSEDGGVSWSRNIPVSPAFDPHLGWPQQNKLGDYYDMVSDAQGAHVAYAATFNGEQDVYYLRIVPGLIFADGFESGDGSAWSEVVP